jgi:hypothetical protein
MLGRGLVKINTNRDDGCRPKPFSAGKLLNLAPFGLISLDAVAHADAGSLD